MNLKEMWRDSTGCV